MLNGKFHSEMNRPTIVKKFKRVATEFGVRDLNDPIQFLLIRIGISAQIRLMIPLPNRTIVFVERTVLKNSTFEDNAAALLHFLESRAYDFRRGAISVTELLIQLAPDIDVSKSHLSTNERSVILQTKQMLKIAQGNKLEKYA